MPEPAGWHQNFLSPDFQMNCAALPLLPIFSSSGARWAVREGELSQNIYFVRPIFARRAEIFDPESRFWYGFGDRSGRQGCVQALAGLRPKTVGRRQIFLGTIKRAFIAVLRAVSSRFSGWAGD